MKLNDFSVSKAGSPVPPNRVSLSPETIPPLYIASGLFFGARGFANRNPAPFATQRLILYNPHDPKNEEKNFMPAEPPPDEQAEPNQTTSLYS